MRKSVVLVLTLLGSGCLSTKSANMCMLTDDVTAVTLRSTGSHADSTRELTVDPKTRRLSGRTFVSDGETFEPVEVDRALEESEFKELEVVLRATCGPVVRATEPPSIGGGATTWTVVAGATTTLFSTAQAANPSRRWVELSASASKALQAAWPDERQREE